MDEFEKQKGIAFFLIYFSADNVFYYLTLRKLKEFWKRMEDGGRKSFRREELDEEFFWKKWISGSLSGRDPERSAITGLTFGKVSYIIKFKFFCGSMVAN